MRGSEFDSRQTTAFDPNAKHRLPISVSDPTDPAKQAEHTKEKHGRQP